MKKILLIVLVLVGFNLNAQEINWVTLEEAVELQNKEPRKIIMDMYTTWCGPCKKELPDIYALSQIHKNVSFYLIDVSNLEQNGKKLMEKPEDVIALLEKLKINLPVLMDKYGLIAEKYGAFLLPNTVIINPDGVLIFEQTGIIDKNDPKLVHALRTI